MELDLLANGLDSLRHGLEHYRDGWTDPSNYKYAIVHVCHCTEMVLKERLEREHASLVYRNVDVVQGNTVSYQQAIDRLQNAAGVVIGSHERERLRNLRDARNDVEHYKVTLDKERASVIIGDALAFLKTWLETELEVDLEEELDADLWGVLLAIDEIYQDHLRKVEEEIGAIGYASKGMEAVHFCPECMTESVVRDPAAESQLKCLMCREHFYEVHCERCDQSMPGYERKGFVLCDGCTDWLDRE